MSPVTEGLLRAGIVFAAFLLLPLIVGQGEHKVMAHMQRRLGPMYPGGFHGWAQLIADGIKFAQKEDVIPKAADRKIFMVAPVIALVPYVFALAALPISANAVGFELQAGLLFVLAASAVSVLGTLMAGWSSGNKYSLLGAMRSSAQVLAYEVPLVLAASSVAVLAGSLNFIAIVEAWHPSWLLLLLPAAAVFASSAVAELQRPPFDVPLADSELVAGPYTEYTGLRFALLLLAEYLGIVVMTGLFTLLFLGGWRGPGPEALGPLWMLLKMGALAYIIMWLRVAWPRVRADQLQRWSWTRLIPVALINIAIVAVWVVV